MKVIGLQLAVIIMISVVKPFAVDDNNRLIKHAELALRRIQSVSPPMSSMCTLNHDEETGPSGYNKVNDNLRDKTPTLLDCVYTVLPSGLDRLK